MSFEDKRYIYPPIAIADTIFDFCYFVDSILTFYIPDRNLEGNLNHIITM